MGVRLVCTFFVCVIDHVPEISFSFLCLLVTPLIPLSSELCEVVVYLSLSKREFDGELERSHFLCFLQHLILVLLIAFSPHTHTCRSQQAIWSIPCVGWEHLREADHRGAGGAVFRVCLCGQFASFFFPCGFLPQTLMF